MLDEAPIQPAPVESMDPPEGMYSTRVDDKGRLKLPEDFKAFLLSLPDKSFFVTTFEEPPATAKVYPMSAWRASKKLLEDEQEDPDRAERLLDTAADYGAKAEIDSQARILVPPDLRRALGIENSPVSVLWKKDGVVIYSDAYRKQRREAARASNAEDLTYMRRKGLK